MRARDAVQAMREGCGCLHVPPNPNAKEKTVPELNLNCAIRDRLTAQFGGSGVRHWGWDGIDLPGTRIGRSGVWINLPGAWGWHRLSVLLNGVCICMHLYAFVCMQEALNHQRSQVNHSDGTSRRSSSPCHSTFRFECFACHTARLRLFHIPNHSTVIRTICVMSFNLIVICVS